MTKFQYSLSKNVKQNVQCVNKLLRLINHFTVWEKYGLKFYIICKKKHVII